MTIWKNGNKKARLCMMIVTACLILAAVWAVLATPETALAAKADPILFRVEQIYQDTEMVIMNLTSLEGRSGTGNQIVINRPTVVMKMDFLDVVDGAANSFYIGKLYSGTLVIQETKGVGSAVFFFEAPGKTGNKLMGYRIDCDTVIIGGDKIVEKFPNDSVGYDITLENLKLSVDTGSRKNGYEWDFGDTVTAWVQLIRKPTSNEP